MNNPTIIVTGGHLTPAQAVIDVLQKKYPSWNIVWVGRKYAFEGTKTQSAEYENIVRLGIPFVSLTTGRLQRKFSFYTIPSLLKIPVGIVQSMLILKKYKPALVVSFGGYIALPVALAAYVLRIPVLTHEQTHHIGASNKIIGLVAKKICVTFPETLSEVPKEKGVLTGLPIRKEIFSPPAKPSFPMPNSRLALLYITGGSTGAQSLNDKLFPFIEKLLESWVVVHQTGEISYKKALKTKESVRHQERYIIAPFFQGEDVAWLLHHARVVIGRSGANTVAELSAVGTPAVLVSLPWAGGNEQEQNARAYVQTGNAVLLDQDSVSEENVMNTLHTLTKKLKHGQQHTQLPDAAHSVAEEIEICLSYGREV